MTRPNAVKAAACFLMVWHQGSLVFAVMHCVLKCGFLTIGVAVSVLTVFAEFHPEHLACKV